MTSNTDIQRFGSRVGLNSTLNKWMITVRDFMDDSGVEAIPMGWTMTQESANDFLNRTANDLEAKMKKDDPGCKVTWENHNYDDLDDLYIKLYVEKPGHVFGYYGRRDAYVISVVTLPKLVDAPPPTEEEKKEEKNE